MLFVSRLDVRDHGGLVNFQELLQALSPSLLTTNGSHKGLHTRRMKAPIKLAEKSPERPPAHSHAPHSHRRRR